MAFQVVIPARYASTRLPGKPLLDIAGKPMVVRVAERAAQSGASGVWIATDHPEIEAAANRHGVRALMTRADHSSGTDRLAEVVMRLSCADDEIIVNVQGDEPLIDPTLIDCVAEALERDSDAAIATASHPISSMAELFNPNVVKVVSDARGRALYFSRAPIPYARDAFAAAGIGGSREAPADEPLPEALAARRHIGLYAYRCGFLRSYTALAPVAIEQFEALEQLRALWYGYRIRVVETSHATETGVDTPEDLERIRNRFDRCAICR